MRARNKANDRSDASGTGRIGSGRDRRGKRSWCGNSTQAGSRRRESALSDLDAERGEALASELGGVFCAVNVTDEASVDAGFAEARSAIGQERILVNYAGIGNAIKTASRDRKTVEIRHFPLADFDKIIQINVVCTFRCIAKSAAGMLGAQVSFPKRLGIPHDYASFALEMIRNPYFNGEDVRLDGAIRMAPR